MNDMLDRDEVVSHSLHNLLHTLLLLGGMLGLLGLLGYLFAGPAGFGWALLLSFGIMFFTPRISPALMQRIYRGQELDLRSAPGLYRMVHELAGRANLSAMPSLFYIPSSSMNAFALGRDGAAAIGVTDGLLRGLNSRELAATLAHEISHIRYGDTRVMALADILSRVTGALSLVGQLLLFINLPLLLTGHVVVPWSVVLLLLGAPYLSSMMQLALSRTREFNADLGAAGLTGDPKALVSALHKLDSPPGSVLMRIFRPQRSEPSILRTHPSIEERIRRLEALSVKAQPTIAAGVLLQALPQVVQRRRGLWR